MSYYISGSDTKSNLALWNSRSNPANGVAAARARVSVQSGPMLAPRIFCSSQYRPFVVGRNGLRFGYLPGTALSWGETIVDGADRLPRATPLWTLPWTQQKIDANREAAKAADAAALASSLDGTPLGATPGNGISSVPFPAVSPIPAYSFSTPTPQKPNNEVVDFALSLASARAAVAIITQSDVCSRVTVTQFSGQRLRFQIVDGRMVVNLPANGSYTFTASGIFRVGTQVGTIELLDSPDLVHNPAPQFLIAQV